MGSFYVFALGLTGAYNLCLEIKKHWKFKFADVFTVSLLFLSVPFLMGFQNWDDHDRSNRYTAQAVAKSYLTSIQKDSDAMIFTIGDNDTFLFGMPKILRGIEPM